MLNVFGYDLDGETGEICSLRCQITHPNARLPSIGSRVRYPSDGPQYKIVGFRRDPYPPAQGAFLLWEVEECEEETSTD